MTSRARGRGDVKEPGRGGAPAVRAERQRHSTRRPRRDDTRERILKGAAALFHQHGYDGVNMTAVAAAAGIRKSSFYHHFSGKQDLLFDILTHTIDAALDGLRQIARSRTSASDRLRAAIRLHTMTLVDDLDNVACFVEEAKRLEPRYRKAYVAKRDAYERLFRQIIGSGIAAGEFRRADVRLTGFAVLGMCNWMVRWFRPGGPNTPEDVARQLGDFAVAALSRPSR